MLAAAAFASALFAPVAAQARGETLELDFDRALGTQVRTPREMPAQPPVQPRRPVAVAQFVAPQVTSYASGLEAQVASLAAPAQGRIGVAALDLSTGRTVSVLGNQPFPLASTSKVAIAATFLAGVDQGRFRLTDQFPLLYPVRSAKYSSEAAPVRPGTLLSAQGLIELVKSLAKVLLLGTIGYWLVANSLPAIMSMAQADLNGAIGLAGKSVGHAMLAMAGGLVVIAQQDPITVVFAVPQDNVPAVMSPAEFTRFVRAESATNAKIVRERNIKAD